MVKMMEMTEKNQLLAKTDDYGTAKPVGVLNTVVRVDLICSVSPGTLQSI